uniref:Uncharacterized protein n=1 Tax=Leptobrachium leishanense TaxID=445787 RepID=A0A8C5W7D5_9ANUR
MKEEVMHHTIDHKLNGWEPCEFEDVAIYFSEEEWGVLSEAEKQLYVEVMLENYQTLLSLGWIDVTPPLVLFIQHVAESYERSRLRLMNKGRPANSRILDGRVHKVTPGGKQTLIVFPDFLLNGQNADHKGTKHQIIYEAQNRARTPVKRGQQEPASRRREHMIEPIVYTSRNRGPVDHYKNGGLPYDGGNWPNTSIYSPPEHMQALHTCTGGKPSSLNVGNDRDLHNPTGRTASEYRAAIIKEDKTSWDEQNLPDTGVCTSPAHALIDSDMLIRSSRTSSRSGHGVNHGSELAPHKKPHNESEGQKALCNSEPVKKTFFCSECNKSFNFKSNLLKHYKTHTGEKPYFCTDCGKDFAYKSNLVTHQITHTGTKSFSCTECNKRFTHRSSLREHQMVHTGKKAYVCAECGKRFTRSCYLVKHHRIHTGEKPYPCSTCSKAFATKSNLITHTMSHSETKPFSCPECEKCFKHKSSLMEHQQSHMGEKAYWCAECRKHFPRSSYLEKHMRIHNGEKPFLCSECGKGFTDRSNLRKHRVIHTGTKNFSCSECNKCFALKGNLVNHEKIHTEETLHPCSECGKRFTRFSYLMKHKKMHRKEKTFLSTGISVPGPLDVSELHLP